MTHTDIQNVDLDFIVDFKSFEQPDQELKTNLVGRLVDYRKYNWPQGFDPNQIVCVSFEVSQSQNFYLTILSVSVQEKFFEAVEHSNSERWGVQFQQRFKVN